MSAAPAALDTSAWFKPLQCGDLTLKNRIIVAPCTRNRANVPGSLQAFYYGMRAESGLIVGEATLPVPQGYEWGNAPGLYNKTQIEGWKKVTDAVHEQGGQIVAQIMNIGRVAHPVLQSGQQNYGPSAVAAKGGNFRQIHNTTYVAEAGALIEIKDSGNEYVQPVALVDPSERIGEYRKAFENAKEAGFDGVEIHGANGYLIAQFFDSGSNQRTDEWGGSPEKRTKFALEVVKQAIEVWGAGRVGIKLSPEGGYNDMGMNTAETLATYGHFLGELNKLAIAYVHVQRWFAMFDAEKRGTIIPERTWRELWKGKLLLNGNFTPEEGLKAIQSDLCDGILFGRDWIANPDLVKRIRENLPLNAPDPTTFYKAGPHGYCDYPYWKDISESERAHVASAWKKTVEAHDAEAKKKEQILEKQQQDEAKAGTLPASVHAQVQAQ